jgi:protein transport protein SEC20
MVSFGSAQKLSSKADISDLQERLVKLNLKIRMRIEAFADCTASRQMEDLNAEVRELLAQFRSGVDAIKDTVANSSSAESKKLLQDAERHAMLMRELQKQFRAANLRCILEIQRRDKEELVGGAGGQLRHRGQGARSADRDSLVKESSAVTDGLSNISRQLAATVERSAKTMEELVQSSQTVEETHQEFMNMGSAIGQSKKLITKYGRREVTDRILILLAFAFFFACVFYILRKRVLGPLDPVSLIWNAVATMVQTIMRLVGF